MRKATISILTLLGVLALTLTLSARTSLRPDSDRLKAEYLFIEGENRLSVSDNGGVEHIERAAQLCPDDEELAYYVAIHRLMFTHFDSATFEESKRALRRMVELHPENLSTDNTYVNLCLQLNDYKEAEWVLNKIDSLHPEETELSLTLAKILLASDDSLKNRRGLAILDRVQTAQNDYTQTSEAKIRYYFQKADTAGVIRVIDEILDKAPNDAAAVVEAAFAYEVIGNAEMSDSLFRLACAIEPPSGWAYYNYAEYLLMKEDTVGYNSRIDMALGLDNLDFDIKMGLLKKATQNLYSDPSQASRIESLFSGMLEQHPHEADLHDLYASYLYAEERFNESAEQFSYVLDSDPSSVDRWVSVIAIYNSADEYGKAIDVCNRALTYFPTSSRLYSLKSGIYTVVNQYDSAIANAHKAIEFADTTDIKTYSQYYSSTGDIYQKLHMTDSACYYYDRALEINPNNILSLNNYAYYLSTIPRDLDKALDMALKVINAEPDNYTYVDTYAWILYQKGEYFQAKQYIDKVLADETYKTPSEVLEHAAAIYEKNGDSAKAEEFTEAAAKRKIEEQEEQEQAEGRMKQKTETKAAKKSSVKQSAPKSKSRKSKKR